MGRVRVLGGSGAHPTPREVNTDGTGRRLYFLGPDGHYLELITARYDDVPSGLGQPAGSGT